MGSDLAGDPLDGTEARKYRPTLSARNLTSSKKPSPSGDGVVISSAIEWLDSARRPRPALRAVSTAHAWSGPTVGEDP